MLSLVCSATADELSRLCFHARFNEADRLNLFLSFKQTHPLLQSNERLLSELVHGTSLTVHSTNPSASLRFCRCRYGNHSQTLFEDANESDLVGFSCPM